MTIINIYQQPSELLGTQLLPAGERSTTNHAHPSNPNEAFRVVFKKCNNNKNGVQ